jgi:hypothetical protein
MPRPAAVGSVGRDARVHGISRAHQRPPTQGAECGQQDQRPISRHLSRKTPTTAPSPVLVSGDREARSRLRTLLLPCAVLGVLVGVAIVVLDLWVFAPRLAVAGSGTAALQPPAWQGLLASFYGAIPGGAAAATGTNDPAGLGRCPAESDLGSGPRSCVDRDCRYRASPGAGHLPTTAAVLPLTPLVIARALLLNGIGGIDFRWLSGSADCRPPCWPTSAPTSFCTSWHRC